MSSSNRSFAAMLDGAPGMSSPVARLFSSPPPGLSGRTPPHPGRMLLSRFLAPSGLTQGDLAKRLGISRRRVNELLNGRRAFTPDTALRLAAFFGNSAEFWMGLQADYDMAVARSSAADAIARIRRFEPAH